MADTRKLMVKNRLEEQRKMKKVSDDFLSKPNADLGDTMWAADRNETSQKNGKVSSKYSSVSFDDKGNYLKSSDNDGVVSQDFKKLGVPIKSGKKLQEEADAAKSDEMGYAKGGKVKSASARADGCAIRGKTRA